MIENVKHFDSSLIMSFKVNDNRLLKKYIVAIMQYCLTRVVKMTKK